METAVSVLIHLMRKSNGKHLIKKRRGSCNQNPCGQSFPRAGLRLDQNPVLLEVIL